MSVYVDSSAAVKLMAEEKESDALAHALEQAAETGTAIRSAALLETELRRAANRLSLSQEAVTVILEGIDLVDMPRSVFAEAGLVVGANLRSLDALHVVTALRCGPTTFISYDARQIEAARAAGLAVASPGR
ncbi:type II toxin-antitoxin system VapC family toxin [Microbacterium aoyamense]|uniref:Ribonuclease VapC n=1 Tax=Microbacterium aoyamense TaxID=344166 RepID=A0ABN2PZX7_9MICO|nr:type II toxin-antitoxin system VapC family toxin [Microbacterium aoyamense]